MAGIYIHIPFCRQKCYYCDFYKTVNTSLRTPFLQALRKEIKQSKSYLHDQVVETIYFGGGTPSVLTKEELNEIIECLTDEFQISSRTEITFEANPDDLSPDYLKLLRDTGINRLSIGIQSFTDLQLKKMNRRHDSKQAIECVENAVNAGFDNISIDLIYGLPGLTKQEWKNSLKRAFDLPVQHLSAYHLTYHEGTAFYTWLKKGTLKESNESESTEQFEILLRETEKQGFEQYEISNFAKNSLYSKHNTSYWLGKNYLGVGPSAHSFNGHSRRWNVADVNRYVTALNSGQNYFEEEVLSKKDKYNEYILTRIRTIWGVSVDTLNKNFGEETANYFLKNIQKYRDANLVVEKNNQYNLSQKGLFISDEIMSNLMII